MFCILSVCKGGGYRYCRTDPPHPKSNAKGLYPLHRVLMENQVGRLLLDDEVVHHKDGNKENDSVGNLELKTNCEHSRLHHPPSLSIKCQCHCGRIFFLKPHCLRQRQRRSKTTLYCSCSCFAACRHAGNNVEIGGAIPPCGTDGLWPHHRRGSWLNPGLSIATHEAPQVAAGENPLRRMDTADGSIGRLQRQCPEG